ncbi:hypothetical protein LSAT2_025474, partial [Lamellibrachia satsuma]
IRSSKSRPVPVMSDKTVTSRPGLIVALRPPGTSVHPPCQHRLLDGRPYPPPKASAAGGSHAGRTSRSCQQLTSLLRTTLLNVNDIVLRPFPLASSAPHPAIAHHIRSPTILRSPTIYGRP